MSRSFILPSAPVNVDDLSHKWSEMVRILTRYMAQPLDAGWDDVITQIQLGSTPPTLDTSTYPGTLLFSGAADNYVCGVAQLSHATFFGRAAQLRPHIHWSKTTADAGGNAVTWEFRHSLVEPNETPSSYSGWQSGTLQVGDLTTSEKHNITLFTSIDIEGKKPSLIIMWELRRVGSSDAYNSNARLLSLDFHYQRIGFGTIYEYQNTAS